MGVLNDNTIIGASAAGDYEIKQSLRFNDDDSAYLSRTPSVAGNRKTWTWSGWVKRGNLGTYQRLLTVFNSSTSQFTIGYTSADKLELFQYTGSYQINLTSTSLYRDASAWYHLTLEIDTTLAASADRVKIYINSEQVTAFDTAVYPTQNTDLLVNDATPLYIGKKDAGDYLDGYLAEVNFIDGLALTPDSFGETGDYGEWKPLRYTGAYGTNGFYLDFKDSGSLGNDAAGSNNWTPNNLAATDQMLDSPTNNFATLNPLRKGSAVVLSEGNTKSATGSGLPVVGSTIASSTGKWYCEVINKTGNSMIGLSVVNTDISSAALGVSADSWAYYKDGRKFTNNGMTTYGSSYVADDVIGISFDADVGSLTFYKNNVSQGVAFTGLTSEDYVFAIGNGSTTHIANFGQDSSFAGNKTAQGNSDSNGIGDFYYAPPAGFLALCTQNLPDPTVVPSEHFNTVLYTGTGAAQSIAGAGFQPDFTWIKARTSTGQHGLVDAVRGRAKSLRSNGTDTENTSTATQDVTSFDADGFSLGTEYNISCNANGATHVAWNWKAGGTGVSNTDGTITSTVSANVEAGFSIVGFIGTGASASVGHGLSSAPEIIIFKNRSAASNWNVLTTAIDGGADYGFLDLTTAFNTAGETITSSVVNIFGNFASSNNYIAYAFHSVDGYSKVGSYTGNGSTDGTFVHCGFRPAYVMWKRTDAVAVWVIQDTTRDEGNTSNSRIEANSSAAEATDNANIDMLSNGFKMRQPYGYVNGSGATYIYLAFAESPFKYSNAR